MISNAYSEIATNPYPHHRLQDLGTSQKTQPPVPWIRIIPEAQVGAFPSPSQRVNTNRQLKLGSEAMSRKNLPTPICMRHCRPPTALEGL